jgi:hypothetical protein
MEVLKLNISFNHDLKNFKNKKNSNKLYFVVYGSRLTSELNFAINLSPIVMIQ